jgi:hypothetical protein
VRVQRATVVSWRTILVSKEILALTLARDEEFPTD